MFKYTMYRTIIICLLLPISISAQDWNWFHSEVAGFSIKISEEFEVEEQTIPTEIGEIKLHSFILKPSDDASLNFLYLINYCDYPATSIQLNSQELIDEFLENSVMQSVEDLKGELIYSSSINLSGYPGKINRIEYQNHQAVVKSKVVIAGQRFYSIQVFSVMEKSLNEDIDLFLDSFQIHPLTKL